MIEAMVETPSADEREALVELVLRRVGLVREREKPGAKDTVVPLATKKRLAELRIARTSVAEIMRQTGLSKTVATRLAGDVDNALGRLRAGRY